MKSHEPFIEPESTYYVYSPSLLGRSMFFYPLTCGHFFYAPGYHLHRASFDSFLLIYVKKGSMYVQTKNESFDAKADEFILINCSNMPLPSAHFQSHMIYRFPPSYLTSFPDGALPLDHPLQSLCDIFFFLYLPYACLSALLRSNLSVPLLAGTDKFNSKAKPWRPFNCDHSSSCLNLPDQTCQSTDWFYWSLRLISIILKT